MPRYYKNKFELDKIINKCSWIVMSLILVLTLLFLFIAYESMRTQLIQVNKKIEISIDDLKKLDLELDSNYVRVMKWVEMDNSLNITKGKEHYE